MWPPEKADESELEVTSLDARPRRLRAGPRLALGKRGRVALAIGAIALAIIAPLVSLAPTRALILSRFATPSPASTTVASLTIVSVGTSATDIASAEWDTLRARPVRLPTLPPGAACPAAQGRAVAPAFGSAIGDGPVYIVGMGTDGVLHATGPAVNTQGSATWGNQFSMFIIAPSYTGPVLARGHQLDGAHELLFNGGLDQRDGFSPATPTLLRQLRIESAPGVSSSWSNWSAYLRMQAPGCYAIQLDGTTFSDVVVFRVVFGG